LASSHPQYCPKPARDVSLKIIVRQKRRVVFSPLNENV
jgi:hypothetical protein